MAEPYSEQEIAERREIIEAASVMPGGHDHDRWLATLDALEARHAKLLDAALKWKSGHGEVEWRSLKRHRGGDSLLAGLCDAIDAVLAAEPSGG